MVLEDLSACWHVNVQQRARRVLPTGRGIEMSSDELNVATLGMRRADEMTQCAIDLFHMAGAGFSALSCVQRASSPPGQPRLAELGLGRTRPNMLGVFHTERSRVCVTGRSSVRCALRR